MPRALTGDQIHPSYCDQLLLATASPRRHTLASVAGLNFVVSPADIDESTRESEPPKQYVERLAIEKGRASAMSHNKTNASDNATSRNENTFCRCEKRHLYISADTVVVNDNEILGKAADRTQAAAFLMRLAGQDHHVITGIAIHERSGDQTKAPTECIALLHSAVVSTTVSMRLYTTQMVECYLDQNEWQGIAGAYTSQGAGAGLIDSIEGSFSNVVGLPVAHLCRELNAIRRARPDTSE